MKRAANVPGRKDLESRVVQCMCVNTICVQVGTDMGSSCFIKC